METYLRELQASRIPLPQWGVVILWLLIFASAQVLFRKSRALSRAQAFVVTGGPPGLVREQSLRLVLVQLLFGGAVLAFASLAGGFIFVFLAGGWVVATAASIPLSFRSVLFLRALSQPGAATGSVTLSSHVAVKDQAFQVFGAATFCLLLGVCFAHLALFGGAFLLLATAFGYLRKANGKTADEPPGPNAGPDSKSG